MKILITGGAGYVGSACLRHLSRYGHDVLAFDNMVEGHPKAVAEHPYVVGDIADTAHLAETLTSFGAEAVMHFAAATNVGESVIDPEYHWRNNSGGSLSVLNAMRSAGVNKLIFSSTSSTYGLTEVVPMNEDSPQVPMNPYANSKLAVEWMIRDFAHAYGLGFTLLRYFNAAGADPSGEFGEYHDPETHIIPRVLEVAQGRRSQFDIYGTDYNTIDGTCLRDYVHIEDLGQAHRLALEATTETTQSVYNIGIGKGYTVREVIDACRRVTNHTIPVSEVARRPGDPSALVSDPTRLVSELGWQPEHSNLENIVRTAWLWQQRYPDGYELRRK